MNLLEWKTILINGASGDIWVQTAIDCYKSGANLVLCWYRNKEKLQSAFSDSGSDAGKVKMFFFDGKDEEKVLDMYRSLTKENIRLDGIFANAWDLVGRFPIQSSTPDLYQEVFDANFRTTYLLVKHWLSLLNEKGSIVLMSSMSARWGKWDRSAHYAMAKSAIIGWWKSLANELALKKQQLRVNMIAPWYITWAFHDRHTLKKVEIEHAESNPMNRVGTPKDVSWVVLFLLSELSSYVNGVTIDINWGSYIN